MYLNKVYIIGNLTRDPELKALPSGTKVANLSIATNRKFKDREGVLKEAVEFHNIVAFAKLGELAAQYLKKGQQALVEGRMQTRSWDAANGEKKYRTEVIAENIQFGWKANGPGAGNSGASAGAGSSGAPNAAASAAQTADEAGAAPDEKAGAPAGGEAIAYPQEEINPDDIPF